MAALEELRVALVDVPKGTEFTARDLFVGWKWDAHSKSERHKYGVLLKMCQEELGIREIGKNGSKHLIYKKL